MSKKQTKKSVSVAIKGNERIYLTEKDEEKGLDIKLDIQGYKIIAL